MSTPTQTTNPLTLKRDDYKTIKHMNKDQMTHYLHRIYTRGYKAGYEEGKKAVATGAKLPQTEK